MKNICIIALAIFLTGKVFAQETFNFLKLDQSPRAAALAGSFVSNNDDPNVIFYNPAGLSYLTESPISFSFVKHLLDINSAAVAYSQEFEGIGRFGTAIQYINYGTFTEANVDGVKTGEFGAGEFAALVGYSNSLDKNFYYGVNVKFIFSGIADRSSVGFAADLGLHYSIPEERWNFGFSVLNLGSQVTQYYSYQEKLPLDVRFGFSKTLKNLPFTFFASLNKLNESYDSFGKRFQQFTFGGEFKMSKVVRLRFGYDNEKRKELKMGGTAGLAGFNLGLGFLISDYNFDYSFSSMGEIGSLHRIGISTIL
ncbi:MAG: type IX secretion system protein PorQ [Ignavibacteriae bacterium]|nr:type IX secretion system protein PorQ [Ignavibacteriota bacterium]